MGVNVGGLLCEISCGIGDNVLDVFVNTKRVSSISGQCCQYLLDQIFRVSNMISAATGAAFARARLPQACQTITSSLSVLTGATQCTHSPAVSSSSQRRMPGNANFAVGNNRRFFATDVDALNVTVLHHKAARAKKNTFTCPQSAFDASSKSGMLVPTDPSDVVLSSFREDVNGEGENNLIQLPDVSDIPYSIHQGYKLQASLLIDRLPLKMVEADYAKKWREFRVDWEERTENGPVINDDITFMRFPFQFLISPEEIEYKKRMERLMGMTDGTCIIFNFCSFFFRSYNS